MNRLTIISSLLLLTGCMRSDPRDPFSHNSLTQEKNVFFTPDEIKNQLSSLFKDFFQTVDFEGEISLAKLENFVGAEDIRSLLIDIPPLTQKQTPYQAVICLTQTPSSNQAMQELRISLLVYHETPDEVIYSQWNKTQKQVAP